MGEPANDIVQYALKNQPKVGEETIYLRLENGKLMNITFPIRNEFKYNINQLQQIGTIVFRLTQDSSHYYPYNELELTNIYKYWVENNLNEHNTISLNTVVIHNRGQIITDLVIVGVLGFIVSIILLALLIRFAFRFWSGENFVNKLIKAKRRGAI
jgi:hypothetical protein